MTGGGRDLDACGRAIRAALERIDGSVTTYEMELKKMSRRRFSLW
ncbi:hypothetical protein SynPROSU1_02127 [Synechococcus sp. PROS-U-1]|nr:hypothetical protein SynPROSU1_02127 [Synechococcus sp. PROS-U-1]